MVRTLVPGGRGGAKTCSTALKTVQDWLRGSDPWVDAQVSGNGDQVASQGKKKLEVGFWNWYAAWSKGNDTVGTGLMPFSKIFKYYNSKNNIFKTRISNFLDIGETRATNSGCNDITQLTALFLQPSTVTVIPGHLPEIQLNNITSMHVIAFPTAKKTT